jgi:arsenate-mycothiol transferase
MPDRPSVMFVCVKNAGKSQMAAGLMSNIAGDLIDVYSAGTNPGAGVNGLSAEALAEVGVDISHEQAKPIDRALLASMTAVVTLGREAEVDTVVGPHFERWNTDEPSDRGIDGIERMRLIRDDIAARVEILRDRLLEDGPGSSAPLR